MKLPPPSRLWALIAAGPMLTITGIGMTLIVWLGGWDKALQPQQLTLLGWGMIANWLLLGVVVVAMASVKVSVAGPGGFHADVDSDDDPAPTVTTTTTTEVKGQPAVTPGDYRP